MSIWNGSGEYWGRYWVDTILSTDGQTDGRTDGRTDRPGETSISPFNFVEHGVSNIVICKWYWVHYGAWWCIVGNLSIAMWYFVRWVFKCAFFMFCFGVWSVSLPNHKQWPEEGIRDVPGIQLHEPRIFYPSGHWPETVTNAHVSAHFR